jgi:group I intron endonuclease
MKAQYGSKKKYHYLYKTTNLINGKFYYGMHSTDNLEDGYTGSGTYLKRSINKYGINNFQIEILEFFDNRGSLVEAERSLISQEYINNKSCYNVRRGGIGGFPEGASTKGALVRVANIMADPERKQKWLIAMSEGHKEYYKTHPGTFLGRNHTSETVEKIRQSAKGKHVGKKNSQFGTKWITDGEENKKVKVSDLVPDGWRLGRKIKKNLQI